MTREQMLDQLRLWVEDMEIGYDEPDEGTRLVDELGLDSLDIAEAVMHLEEATRQDSGPVNHVLHTVSDLLDLFEEEG